MTDITFQPKWKEELVCTSDAGSFTLVMTMGVLTVYFPDAETFSHEAPQWAQGEWDTIHTALSDWCKTNSIPLVVDDESKIYTD